MAPPLPPKTSELLKDLRDAFPGDEPISVRDVLKRLDGRAIGLLLLILALPNCIPNIPGISTIFGFLLIAPSVQMLIGKSTPWIPRQIGDMQIGPGTFRRVIDWAMPSLERVEKLVRPRLQFLTQKPVSYWFGIQTLILALILILPIPGANWLPGMGIASLAIALLQRDGVFAIASFGFFLATTYLTAILGPMVIGGAITALIDGVLALTHWLKLSGH